MADRVELEQMLSTAQRALTVLEQQAAAYTSLTIPAHLKVQLEDKRQEVTSLEARLARLQSEKSPGFVTKPGIFRYYLDRWFPRLHQKLTDEMGALSNPPERSAIENHLRNLQTTFTDDLDDKEYVRPIGKPVPHPRPSVNIKHLILHIHGRMSGGDSASAQIAAASHRSRPVRNILVTLNKSKEPLILLGEPGSGKTMTLKRLAISLIGEELKRVFPRVLLFVRLGDFYVSDEQVRKWKEEEKDERVKWREEVFKHVVKSTTYLTPELIDRLRESKRLIIFFDGMDEMSREWYGDYTDALSDFARFTTAKTLFTCRIADFSPNFQHERLILMPFGHKQVTEYLKRFFEDWPVWVDGQSWHQKQLAAHITNRELPVHADNPFVLSLLCPYLNQHHTWPNSRMDLLRFYIEEVYRHYIKEDDDREESDGTLLPVKDEAGWAQLAYVITERNQGSSIFINELTDAYSGKIAVTDLIETGRKCGILVVDENKHEVRFEHHRFQEYFCAIYTETCQPEIEWPDKFDSPRWQEVVLNVILLNDSNQ